MFIPSHSVLAALC